MPLRPIDLQSIIPKVSSIAKSKQALVQQEANALVNVQLEAEKQEARKREVVQTLNQTDKLTIEHKKERSSKDGRGEKRRKKKRAESDGDDAQRHLDIRI